MLVVVGYAGWWGLGRWTVNEYALTPGDAQPVAPFIAVPSHLNHKLSGSILLTDVYVTQLTALTYLQERFFSSVAQVEPASALLGPATPADQFVAQGYLEMTQAQQAATAAALTHLGYTVGAQNVGALIFGVVPGSPAYSVLKVAQVVTAVNGTAVTNSCALSRVLDYVKGNSTVTFSVEQSTISGTGVFRPGPIVKKKVTLGVPPKGFTESGSGCGGPSVPPSYLGVETETQYNWTFPVKVAVHTADIGGPSAGLAMTLGIIDKLSGGKLTGGRVIAATGTIDAAGQVGDVGGVAQKTIAVERAGASVFFVPPEELKAAKSKDTPQLHVYAVSTLDQALKILEKLGGKLPAKHVSGQAAP